MGASIYGSSKGSSSRSKSIYKNVKAPSSKKRGGGGAFGGILHTVERGAADLRNAAYDSPLALYGVGKATLHDVRKAGVLPGMPRSKGGYQLPGLAYGQAKATLQDVKHPLRHPGYTALDVLAIASLGAGSLARVGAAGKALKAGDLGEAARGATFGPRPGTVRYSAKLPARGQPASKLEKEISRTYGTRQNSRAAGVVQGKGKQARAVVNTPASRSALTRQVQRARAKVYSNYLSKNAERKVLTELYKQGKVEREPYGGRPEGFAKTLVNAADTVTNGARMADLYLKGAYFAPNFGGNAAVSLFQQGFLLPRNTARAVKLYRTLPKQTRHQLLESVGIGGAKAIGAPGGKFARTVNWSANAWGKVIDEPFRVTSFVHEASRDGIKTPKQFGELLNDGQTIVKGKTIKLEHVGQRANEAAIDYGNMSNFEKSIARRIIYFYPWVKGSSRYALRMLRENQGTLATLAQQGKQAQDKYGFKSDEIPSYLRGSIKAGHNKMINPAALSILGTPGQVGEILTGGLSGNPEDIARPSEMLTPAVNLVGSLAYGLNRYAETRQGRKFYQAPYEQLVQSSPQYALINRILHGGTKSFPMTPKEAIAQYMIGGLAKRRYNPESLRRTRHYELHPPKH